MNSRYHTNKRSVSPGAQRLNIPGRASTGTFATSYDDHPHEHRHNSVGSSASELRHNSVVSTTASTPRTTKGAIPISTEVIYHGTSKDPYSGRPRRGTIDSEPSTPALRPRQTGIQNTIGRPSSPLARSFNDHNYIKSNTSVRRSEPKTKLYSVDNDSAKLIAETEHERERKSRRERQGYHLTGASRRPREFDESAYSYTDAAGMFNETEPVRRRQRRGSVDSSTSRRSSIVDATPYPSYNRTSRDMGPPPTIRRFDKVNDLSRTSSVREPVRGASRDRQNSYDTYGRDIYEPNLRTASTMPVIHDSRHNSRDESYYRDDYDDRQPRRMSRQFTDENVQSRGFGIRTGSADHYGGSSSSSAEPPVAKSIYPQTSGAYANQPLVKTPSASDYAPPVLDDRKDSVRTRERDYEKPRDYEREYDRDSGSRHHHRRLSRDVQPASGAVSKDSALPAAAAAAGVAGIAAAGAAFERRDHERERDNRERHHHRRLSRETSTNRSAPTRDIAVPAASAAVGTAAVGAAADQRERRSDRNRDSDEERERYRRPRQDPNDREDQLESRYAEKDRKESKAPTQVDPDEEYRRRVAQFKNELSGGPTSNTRSVEEAPISRVRSNEDAPISRVRSKDEDRSDSDRERQRKRDQDERVRERRQSVDRSSRRGSDEDKMPPPPPPPPKDSRSRDLDGESLHNRPAENRHLSDKNYYVQEPDTIPGAYPNEPHSGSGWGPGYSQSTNTLSKAPPSPIVAPLPVPEIAPRSRSADPAYIDKLERRVTIVEPPKDEPVPPAPVKGILRKPTAKFPEDPNPIREGVTPLKERIKGKEGSGGKAIPEGAKWTKIDRRLVNPQALEEKQERFEERKDAIIVLRVLTREEIQDFANRTAEIREEREERYNREHKHRSHRHHDSESSDSDEKDHHSSRHHRDDRDRERDSGRDRDRDSGRDTKDRDRDSRDYRRSRDYDDYSSENEAAMRAIEEGNRRRNDRERKRDEEYMSGGLARSER